MTLRLNPAVKATTVFWAKWALLKGLKVYKYD
jgi:hypothetical protein